MKRLAALLGALAALVFLLFGAPVAMALVVLTLLCADCVSVFGRSRPTLPRKPSTKAASVVIPTWNGKHHLECTLPALEEAVRGGDHEIIVIDNASEDGTVEYLAREHPTIRVAEMGSNLGFGRACNAGLGLARHDVVVLLNNDMRVEPDFLQPLLDGFQDPRVFAVTSQIYFEDTGRVREETGLTSGSWQRGRLQIRHVVDREVDELFPAFYAGGGSSAFDRPKVLELGGFDEILAPFYVEDVDLSYLAWKRGWVVLYAPASVVHHQHRGTIGRHFDPTYVERVLQKNRLLFVWKNIHSWGRLFAHFGWLYVDLWATYLTGPHLERPGLASLVMALRQLLRLGGRRIASRRLAEVSDDEALRRPLPGFFRDRYHRLEARPEGEVRVLFVSPYAIDPPRHGGAVFMKQVTHGLATRSRLHLQCLVESEAEQVAQQALADRCARAEIVQFDPSVARRAPLSWPHAARTYWDQDLRWRIHRTILLNRIDIVQLEYAQLASYGERFNQIVCCLFEHDLHFQAVQRGTGGKGALRGALRFYEYLRALRFELRALARIDAVQVCSADQRRLLRGLLGEHPPVHDDLRTAIDVDSYPYRVGGREPGTLLFVGNFRHPPNVEALEYLLDEVMPVLRKRRPDARLVVGGDGAPAHLHAALGGDGVEHIGPFDDIRNVLGKYAVFVAPILSGSGVRVKILEAFACGIPVVSTTLGAEGLARPEDGLAAIADRPTDFADAVAALLDDEGQGSAMAREARLAVEKRWHGAETAPKLLAHYHAVLETKLLSRPAQPLPMRLDG